MTAAARRDPEPHPLALGASPAVIKQWLLPEDASRFVAAYEAALEDARTALDLAGVNESSSTGVASPSSRPTRPRTSAP